MTSKQLLRVNQIMELIWMFNGSSMGLSNNQADELKDMYKTTTEAGKEFFKNWASENDLQIPEFLN